jgi:hypothetical protein
VGGSSGTTKSSSAESIHHQQGQGTGGCSTPVQPRTASIRARPTSSRITAAELEELFQRQQGCSNGNSLTIAKAEWLMYGSFRKLWDRSKSIDIVTYRLGPAHTCQDIHASYRQKNHSVAVRLAGMIGSRKEHCVCVHVHACVEFLSCKVTSNLPAAGLASE